MWAGLHFLGDVRNVSATLGPTTTMDLSSSSLGSTQNCYRGQSWILRVVRPLKSASGPLSCQVGTCPRPADSPSTLLKSLEMLEHQEQHLGFLVWIKKKKKHLGLYIERIIEGVSQPKSWRQCLYYWFFSQASLIPDPVCDIPVCQLPAGKVLPNSHAFERILCD